MLLSNPNLHIIGKDKMCHLLSVYKKEKQLIMNNIVL